LSRAILDEGRASVDRRFGATRMADRYESFAALAEIEKEGVHYRIRVVETSSPVAILAPHGGFIEPGTSQIAAAIATDAYSLYCFESLAPRRRGEGLHITSTRFDEPRALRLIEASDVVVGVHGCKSGDDEAVTWVGGLHERLRDAIRDRLAQAGFDAKSVGDGHPLAGRDASNICNRGRRGAGVQLETPRGLRRALVADNLRLDAFAAAVREALECGIRDGS